MTERFAVLEEVEAGLVDETEAAFLTAVWNSMLIVRRGQLRLSGMASSLKGDGSFLTDIDISSEQAAAEVFAAMLPDASFRSEEGTVNVGTGASRIGWDPTDGTRPLTVGAPNSVVIGAEYGPDGAVRGAVIGEPVTGRVYSAFGEGGVTGRLLVPGAGGAAATAERVDDVSVWRGGLSEKGQVFIDNNLPFSRQGHTVMNAQQHTLLRVGLQERNVGVLEMGSNGAHQLYVARGGERAAGAITTARGIQEDTSAGAFMVERAGGVAQRFMAVDGVIEPVEGNIESPEYDMLVVANTEETLGVLKGILGTISVNAAQAQP